MLNHSNVILQIILQHKSFSLHFQCIYLLISFSLQNLTALAWSPVLAAGSLTPFFTAHLCSLELKQVPCTESSLRSVCARHWATLPNHRQARVYLKLFFRSILVSASLMYSLLTFTQNCNNF